MENEALPTTWESLGLRKEILDLIAKAEFKAPTPVQGEAIPKVLTGQDLVVSAQTGTGKTAAFVLPLVEKLIGRGGTLGLILAPSREIALQTQAALTQFAAPFGIRSAVLIGGTSLNVDETELRNYPQIIVATPGRLCDHLDRGNIWLEYLEFLVLDEADRMLEMGFATQLNRILEDTPLSRQTLLFSATLSTSVEKLASRILYQPYRIQIGSATKATDTVDQHFLFIEEANKFRALQNLIREERGTIFVFTRSKMSAERLSRTLRNRGFHGATELHSNLEQNEREQALQDFKDGKYRVLIATDVVGRGIHVDNVAHVVNYDLPRDASDYIHRIGRTGRAESRGKATTFITPKDRINMKKIEKSLGKSFKPQAQPQTQAQPTTQPKPRIKINPVNNG